MLSFGRVCLNLGAAARDLFSSKPKVASAGVWAQLYCSGWPRVGFCYRCPCLAPRLKQTLPNDNMTTRMSSGRRRAPLNSRRKADLHTRVAPPRRSACRRCFTSPCSRYVRHLRGRGGGDPRGLRSGWRVGRCGRAAPALPRHHRHCEGTGMRPDHRWLDAVAPAAPPADEVEPATQGLKPGGSDGLPARSYTAWRASVRGGEGPLRPWGRAQQWHSLERGYIGVWHRCRASWVTARADGIRVRRSRRSRTGRSGLSPGSRRGGCRDAPRGDSASRSAAAVGRPAAVRPGRGLSYRRAAITLAY